MRTKTSEGYFMVYFSLHGIWLVNNCEIEHKNITLTEKILESVKTILIFNTLKLSKTMPLQQVFLQICKSMNNFVKQK